MAKVIRHLAAPRTHPTIVLRQRQKTTFPASGLFARRLHIFGWLTLGAFDGEELARQSDGVVTGDARVTIRWKRAIVLLAASYAVHLLGLLAFWWIWTAGFGEAGRTISSDHDIPLAYADLVATGLVAGALALASIRASTSAVLALPQTLSLFLCTTWLWSVVLIAGFV